MTPLSRHHLDRARGRTVELGSYLELDDHSLKQLDPRRLTVAQLATTEALLAIAESLHELVAYFREGTV